MENIDNKTGIAIEQAKPAKEVIDSALNKIKEKYGTGIGDGENPKSYHNFLHTKNVVESARRIAVMAIKNGKIESTDGILTEIAASFHDIEYNSDLRGGANEIESGRLAEEEMVKTGAFTPRDIDKVKKMILSTIVSFDEKGVMRQSETDDYLTKIMTDADLSSLGQPAEIYWQISQGLLKEINKINTPTRQEQLDWAIGQIAFLSSHEFHTEEARKLFPHKQANIEFVKDQIKRLGAGNNWTK